MKRALRRVLATRYVAPLREGGSLPAIAEGDDCGTYVLKFRGAGQGEKALVAEVVAGEIARALGLAVPELILMEVDPVLGRSEPDAEIRGLLRASAGLNLALDYLPGSIAFDPALGAPDATLCAQIVWFDALVSNVDRTARNTNLLLWHKRLYLIDHGAALYFQHQTNDYVEKSTASFAQIRDHVLLPFAGDVLAADERLAPLLTTELLTEIVHLVPDEWLAAEDAADRASQAEALRAALVAYFVRRLSTPRAFAKEAAHARSQLV